MENLLSRAQEIRIVFFDIDDTLREVASGLIPESVSRAFAALRKKGILTAIATGRNFYGVVPEVKALGADFYVTANGAYDMAATGEVIYEHHIPRARVSALLDWLTSEASDYIFYGPDRVVASRWDALIADAIVPIYGELSVDPEYYLKAPVYQVLSISDHDQALVMPEDLARELRMVRWHEHSSDIVPLKGSKADGAAKILSRLGLTAENAMNFGDGLNDRELFDFTGLGVAMAGSHPEILAKADYVTSELRDDGIYKALKTLDII
ncbi:MAG: Cof-type HAD-IIB family hydrolase [Streptococcaceae bacterium]|jgi:Cof subfamily protein (haloacid dehalogenase superfamily)|nr:Cof-type HAD-IIB family hydrolase [Streptococcaceae bacterium]